MDFASPFVYVGEVEEEEILDQELQDGWAVSNPVLEEDASDSENDLMDLAADVPVANEVSDVFGAAAVPPPPAGAPPVFATNAAAPPAPQAQSAPGFFASLFGRRPQQAPPQQQQQQQARKEKRFRLHAKYAKSAQSRVHRQAVDTNVVSIKLGTLADDVALHTGEAVFCSNCNVVLSAISKVHDGVWTCDFCDTDNIVDLVPEEVPVSESVDFILKPAPAVAASQDDTNVIFCLDTSGSMCVSTEVQGRLQLRGDRSKQLGEELRAHAAGSQFLPGQRRDVTYVSRLQSVQAAVEQQIMTMKKEHPQRRVGFVTFSDDVQIIGDGSSEPVVLAGDKLKDREAITKAAQEKVAISQPIGESGDNLSETLFALEEGGQTALGPALLASVVQASTKPGSQVFVCTDGLANVGIGSLDLGGAADAVAESQAAQFYRELGEFAKSKGVTVSVISIEGSECKLEHLGITADITGGDVERVNPLTLSQNFQSMLRNPVIATQVTVQLTVHHGLYLRDDEAPQVSAAAATNTTTTCKREPGNVNADTEITFEFGVRDETKFASARSAAGAAGAPAAAAAAAAAAASAEAAAAAAAAPLVDLSEAAPAAATAPAEEPLALPFQVQIRFTRPNGMQCLRVLTKKQPITKERARAEQNVNVALCSAHVAQKSARLAQTGDYESARLNAYAYRNMMGRACTSEGAQLQQQQQFSNFVSVMDDLDSHVQQAQMEEVQGGLLGMADMDRDTRQLERASRRKDSQSRSVFKMKKAAAKSFL